MYSHWNKIPTKAYELLPYYCWIWGKNQKNSGIFNNLKTKHKYVIVGKTQLDFWERNKKFLDEDFINEQKKFLKKKKNHKKIVLFSATFTDIPKIIFPLIKQSPKNWLWLIRAHPRHSNLEEIKLQFKKKGISNVEIDFPSLSSLNFLLKNISHLIVEFSSVVYDALYFNVPSVVLQKNYSHFKNNITNKNLKFSVNKNEIIKFIKNRTVHIKYEKIVSGKKFACNAVKKIIKN